LPWYDPGILLHSGESARPRPGIVCWVGKAGGRRQRTCKYTGRRWRFLGPGFLLPPLLLTYQSLQICATMGLKQLLSSVLLVAPLALAHPGHKEEIFHHAANPLERKSLDHCSREFAEPEFIKRTVEIHGEEYARLRRQLGLSEPVKARKLSPRDYLSVSRIDHKTNKAVSKGMDVSTLFSDAGACMLMPVVDEGPLCTRYSGCGRRK